MEINISIMSGAGNIFAVIDNSLQNLNQEFYSSICSKIIKMPQFLIRNCEGILILNNSEEFDFDVWFFNPDGSSGMMCGNGGRCAFEYAYKNQLIKSKRDFYTFSMAGAIYKVHYTGEMISIYMPIPILYKPNFEVIIDNYSITGSYINVGSDHFVFDYEKSSIKNVFDFQGNELIEFVEKIRNRYDLFPRGTNVNYYKKLDYSKFQLRTFERGVENITGACGTGAISTSWHLVEGFYAEYPVTIIPPSGMELEISIDMNEKEINNLILTGSAEIIEKFNVYI